MLPHPARSRLIRPALLALALGLVAVGAFALARPDATEAAEPTAWVDAPFYGSAGGGFYWDFRTGQVWTSERGWHLYSPAAPAPTSTLWVNFEGYGSASGGFYLDPLTGQVWTSERGWHTFEAPAGPPPAASPTTAPVDCAAEVTYRADMDKRLLDFVGASITLNLTLGSANLDDVGWVATAKGATDKATDAAQRLKALNPAGERYAPFDKQTDALMDDWLRVLPPLRASLETLNPGEFVDAAAHVATVGERPMLLTVPSLSPACATPTPGTATPTVTPRPATPTPTGTPAPTVTAEQCASELSYRAALDFQFQKMAYEFILLKPLFKSGDITNAAWVQKAVAASDRIIVVAGAVRALTPANTKYAEYDAMVDNAMDDFITAFEQLKVGLRRVDAQALQRFEAAYSEATGHFTVAFKLYPALTPACIPSPTSEAAAADHSAVAAAFEAVDELFSNFGSSGQRKR